jgi:hypothetical protein
MKFRETIDCGCVVLSDDVTGAIWFGRVAVTTMSEPSAIDPLVSATSAALSSAASSAACAMFAHESVAMLHASKVA